VVCKLPVLAITFVEVLPPVPVPPLVFPEFEEPPEVLFDVFDVDAVELSEPLPPPQAARVSANKAAQ